MRYLEILIILFLLSFSGMFIFGTIKTYKDLSDKNAAIKSEKDACNFISESFKNTCEGKGFESLYKWQKCCSAIWDLKYIAWCDAKDFLPIPKEYDKKVLYGTWIGKNWEGEVYCEVEK